MQANGTTLDLSITGMTCGSCVRHVTEALRAVDGVEAVRVDLGSGTAEVRYGSASATPERLVQVVEEAGYRASVAPRGGAGKDGPGAPPLRRLTPLGGPTDTAPACDIETGECD